MRKGNYREVVKKKVKNVIGLRKNKFFLCMYVCVACKVAKYAVFNYKSHLKRFEIVALSTL